MDDLTSDMFLKKSALKKAMCIKMTEITHTTIGPQSVSNKNDTVNKLENIENKQNSCNINNHKGNTSPKYQMVSTTSGISFSIRKIIKESERQSKEEVTRICQEKMAPRIQDMNKNTLNSREKLKKQQSSMALERERKSAEDLAHIRALEEQKAEQEEMKRQHEQQLNAQRAQEQKERYEREMEEYKKQMKEELIRAVVKQRGLFAAKYNDFVTLSKSCKDKYALDAFSTGKSKIMEMSQQIGAVDVKIRSGDVTAADLSAMENLVHRIQDTLNLFRAEIEKAAAQYELAQAELAHKAQIISEAQIQVTETENTPTERLESSQPIQQPAESDRAEKQNDKDQSTNTITNQETTVTPSAIDTSVAPPASDPESEETPKDSVEHKEDSSHEYVDEESWNIYNRSRKFLAIYEQAYSDFLRLPETKTFRLECQKAINIPVNAISNQSEHHLRDKYDRLQNLLIGKSSPNVMQYPQGIVFCKDHLAKNIVSQGDTLVSSKPTMAFPIAAVVVALWNEHSDFGELFLAHLHKACPFAVPVFPLQQPNQSNEDYYKSLGCKYSEDGTVEKQDKYLKRMSGLIRLYASITVTQQRKGVTKIHPHGLQYAWRWLTAVLNNEPRADTCDLCATLMLDMLEVTGYMLWTAYPRQFYKLLLLLVEQYYPRMQNIAGGGGPLMRLKDFLSTALAKGVISPPDELLPPNFW